MNKQKVGMAVMVILLLSVSTIGFNIPDTEEKDINYQKADRFPIRSFNHTGDLTCFCAPDNSYRALKRLLDTVNRTLLISVYSFQNIHLARSISNMSNDGVDVNILVESDPVGGVSEKEKYCLDLMISNGVRVRGTDPEGFNYSYLHSKYIIADGTQVLISSENLGYTGYPLERTNGNRGWGVILDNEDLAEYYLDVFYDDWDNSKTISISSSTIIKNELSRGFYKPEFGFKTFNQSFKIKPVLGPDHTLSDRSILNMIRKAETQIYVQQFYVGDWKENPYVEELIQAAERGCEVKILLDSTWYNIKEDEEDNDDFVKYIDNYSERNDLDIECKLIDRYHRFTKTHNKGMIIDGKQVLISSINWNLHSITSNREVGIIIENQDAAEYFQDIFLHDWDDDLIKPIPEAGKDRTVDKGRYIVFNGEHSWDDGQIVSYLWDLDDDGQFEKRGKKVNHKFEKEGVYKVSLKVIDEEGHESVDRTTVKVKEKNKLRSDLYFLIIPISIIMIVSIIYIKRYKR